VHSPLPVHSYFVIDLLIHIIKRRTAEIAVKVANVNGPSGTLEFKGRVVGEFDQWVRFPP
jgi:hypothetical protein